jgi:hypothetical protein
MFVKTDEDWKKVEEYLEGCFAVTLSCDAIPVEIQEKIYRNKVYYMPFIEGECIIKDFNPVEVPDNKTDWKTLSNEPAGKLNAIERYYFLKKLNVYKCTKRLRKRMTKKQFREAGYEAYWVLPYAFASFKTLKAQYRKNFKTIALVTGNVDTSSLMEVTLRSLKILEDVIKTGN